MCKLRCFSLRIWKLWRFQMTYSILPPMILVLLITATSVYYEGTLYFYTKVGFLAIVFFSPCTTPKTAFLWSAWIPFSTVVPTRITTIRIVVKRNTSNSVLWKKRMMYKSVARISSASDDKIIYSFSWFVATLWWTKVTGVSHHFIVRALPKLSSSLVWSFFSVSFICFDKVRIWGLWPWEKSRHQRSYNIPVFAFHLPSECLVPTKWLFLSDGDGVFTDPRHPLSDNA